MRISDWSSDVCSSDLASLVAALADESVLKGEDLLPLLAFATRNRQAGEAAAEQHRRDEDALVQHRKEAGGLQRRRTRVDESMERLIEARRAHVLEAEIGRARDPARRTEEERDRDKPDQAP